MQVTTFHGYPPQVIATAMAMHSRSPRSLAESLLLVTEDKAGDFFEKFYGQYGHASIADMAHLVLAFEGLTHIEVFDLWRETLVDGQEQSTRYQNFDRPDSVTVPPEIKRAGAEMVSWAEQQAAWALDHYRYYATMAADFLRERRPRPSEMGEKQYESTINARAFDVARYWLVNGTETALSQTFSARTFEKLVRRLLASPYDRCRQLAMVMVQAAMEQLPTTPHGLRLEQPVASGLAKHLEADQYELAFRHRAQELAAEVQPLTEREATFGPRVRYHSLWDLVKSYSKVRLDVALLLYEHSHLPLEVIAGTIGETRARAIYSELLDLRGDFDQLPHSLAADRAHLVEFTMDIGGLRDLHRHRNCVRLYQGYTTELGWTTPDVIVAMGRQQQWTDEMATYLGAISQPPADCGRGIDYLLPFGVCRRSLYAMDTQQLQYLVKLRTTPQGHPAYRFIAAQIARQAIRANPHLAGQLRHQRYVSDLDGDIFRR